MWHKDYEEVNCVDIDFILHNYYINESKEVKVYNLPPEYIIIKNNYHHMDPNRKYWDMLIIDIWKRNEHLPLEKICSFGRNYPSFNAAYARQNNTDYLITSSDYQTITIINLNTGEIKSYADKDCLAIGGGFCPIYFDTDEDYLMIEGCVWGGPMERMHCHDIDFANPTKAFNNAEWTDDEDNSYDEFEDEED